jgi:hypothetical protein
MADRCCQLFVAGTCEAGALCPLMHINPRKARAAMPAAAAAPALKTAVLGTTALSAPPSFSVSTWAAAASRGVAVPEPARVSASAPPRLPAPAPAPALALAPAPAAKGRKAREEPFRGPCFRTKPCKWHFGGRGECHQGDLCSFSHERDSLVRALAAGEVSWEISKSDALEASPARTGKAAHASKAAGASKEAKLPDATSLPAPAPAHAHAHANAREPAPPTAKARARFRTEPCRHFARGSCELGDACAFMHDDRPASANARKAAAETARPAALSAPQLAKRERAAASPG